MYNLSCAVVFLNIYAILKFLFHFRLTLLVNVSGVFDADMFGPSCMQPRLARSGRRTIDIWNPDNLFKENCLTLNIWTPYPRRTNSSVMVCTQNKYNQCTLSSYFYLAKYVLSKIMAE